MSIVPLPKKIDSLKQGFTLIEVVVALGIGILVLTIVTSVMAPGLKNMRAISRTKQLHSNTVYVLDTLTYEIRQAKRIEVLSPSSLRITRPDATIKTIMQTGDNISLDGVSLNSIDVKIIGLNFTGMPRSVRVNFTIGSSGGNETFPVLTTIAQRNN